MYRRPPSGYTLVTIEFDSIMRRPLRNPIRNLLGTTSVALGTTSDTVVSSTYSHALPQLPTTKSFISTRNGHGPSSLMDPGGRLAPLGVTGLREFDSLGTIQERKSVIQLKILVGRFNLHNFSTSILRSIRSNGVL